MLRLWFAGGSAICEFNRWRDKGEIMYRVAKDMIDLVGYTPLVKINHIVPNKKVTVYAKLERYNPGGSVKDRIAKYMIEYGEREGLLTKE